MPHIKRPEIPFSRIQRLLKGYGMDGPSLGEVLMCSAVTARSRLNNPETLTLAELRKINTRGHIPWEEIMEAMKW